MTDQAHYFATPAEFRRWLKRYHATADELWVGFHKRHTTRPSMTWPQSVDEALCYGWIDGLRRRVDDDRYVIRFTPRRAGSRWSAVNIRRVKELMAAKLMMPAGQRVFEARKASERDGYSYGNRPERLSPAFEREFRKQKAAWVYYQAQPLSYRRAVNHWVLSAKREDTRHRRLARLIADCAAGRWMAGMRWARQPAASAGTGTAASGRTRRRSAGDRGD